MNMNYGDSPLSIFPICLWYIRNGYDWHFGWYYLMGGRLVLDHSYLLKQSFCWKLVVHWCEKQCHYGLCSSKTINCIIFIYILSSILIGLSTGSVICFNSHIVGVQVWGEVPHWVEIEKLSTT